MPHVLPPDWQDVVSRVSGWLDDATAQLDRHESAFLLRFPTSDVTPPDTSALVERLRELPRRLAPLEAAALEADAAARESEAALRRCPIRRPLPIGCANCRANWPRWNPWPWRPTRPLGNRKRPCAIWRGARKRCGSGWRNGLGAP